MRAFLRHPPAIWIVVLLGLVTGACAAPAPLPALVAKSDAGRYGYSDTKLADGRYLVVYETPSFVVPLLRADRDEEIAAERQRAFDFALWRASELARDQGFAALMVEQDRRDADVRVRVEPRYPPWPGLRGPFYRYPYPYWTRDPYGDCCWAGTYQRWADAQVTVTLQVRFLRQRAEGALSVDETLERLTAAYGAPTYP